jgi:general secretion pathway protein I
MRARGFSLLEVLVAFSILALSLGVLMQIFSGSLNNATVARDQTAATLIAQSLLAATGADSTLVAGERQGTHGEQFRWQLSVSPVAAEASGASGTVGWRLPADLWQISARVAWGDIRGNKERAVTLNTLRVQVRKP